MDGFTLTRRCVYNESPDNVLYIGVIHIHDRQGEPKSDQAKKKDNHRSFHVDFLQSLSLELIYY